MKAAAVFVIIFPASTYALSAADFCAIAKPEMAEYTRINGQLLLANLSAIGPMPKEDQPRFRAVVEQWRKVSPELVKLNEAYAAACEEQP